MTERRRATTDNSPDGLRGVLLLEDGTTFSGTGLGHETSSVGEVVFTTGMVGYPESITDPSYRGQILLFTYPLIGNYGVRDIRSKDKWGLPAGFESQEVQPRAVIFRSTTSPNHWLSRETLHKWLKDAEAPGLAGIDTRKLTEILRSGGVQRGIVSVGRTIPPKEELLRRLRAAPEYVKEDLVSEVAPSAPDMLHSGKKGAPLVAVLDCGCKASILRALLNRGVDVIRLPPGKEFPERWDGKPVSGYLLGNGPGDPVNLSAAIQAITDRPLNKPLLGICLGHQLLATSAGAKTYKMKFGHRGQNKPAIFERPLDRGFILSENHGFAVDGKSLAGTGLKVWARNPDDGTIEGLRDGRGMTLCVQGHPEGGPGPREASFVFDEFVSKLLKRG